MTPSTLFGNLHSLRVHLDVQRRDMKAGVSRDVLDDHIEALNEVIEALSPRGSVAALAVLRAPEGGTHGCKVTKEFTCELDPETVRAMRPLPTPPPADLVRLVLDALESDATVEMRREAWNAVRDAWTPAAPVPAQAGEPTRPTPVCAAHGILACEVCMTDEAFAAPQEPPTIEPMPRIQVDDMVDLDGFGLCLVPYEAAARVVQDSDGIRSIERAGVVIWRRPTPGDEP